MQSAFITKVDQEIPLTGAQQGLVLSATSEGNIVHWPGIWPLMDSSNSLWVIGMMSRLPFQVGTPLPTLEEEGSTDILSSTTTTESGTKSTIYHGHSQESLHASRAPDVDQLER
jgi:hypothetical protein